MKIRIGIDIGSKGAWSMFVKDELIHYSRIPSNETELDMGALLEEIENTIPRGGDHSIHVAMEDLHSVFGSSAKSNFQFGVNNGLVIGMIQAAGLPYTKVQAKKWQKEIWEGIRPVEILVKGKTNKDGSPKYKTDTKATSLIAAKRLFPNEAFLPNPRIKISYSNF